MISQFMPIILKLVLPKATDHIAKVFKLDKVLKYVEQPNEADKKIKEVDQREAIHYADLCLKFEALSEVMKKQNE